MRTLLIESAILLGIAAILVDACSWRNPVWPKNPRSDTPLFRFVVGADQTAKAGYINANGRIVIPPQFKSQGDYGYDDFFDGIALVTTGGQSWYIDSKGRKLFRNRNSGLFSQGLVEFSEGGKSGYLNRQGGVAIPPSFDDADRFSEGLAAVQIGQKYGYIDAQGQLIIKPSFASAFPFKNGFARVIKQAGCLYVGYGPCDAFNPVILPFTRLRYRNPTGKEPSCKYSFIDKTGRELSSSTYREAKDFSEQLAPVGDGLHWGFINTSGTILIPFSFWNAESFSEGLAAVQINNKWGYINHSGKFAIAPTFSTAFPFSEGVALTSSNRELYEFIDQNGKRAVPGSFTAASSFVMGRAHVRFGYNYENSSWAYIDHFGHAVFRYNEHGLLAP